MTTSFGVKVVAGASRDEIGDWLDDTLKVYVRAVRERGRANQAMQKLLAKTLGIPTSLVVIKSGHTSPRKIISIEGMRRDELVAKLRKGD